MLAHAFVRLPSRQLHNEGMAPMARSSPSAIRDDATAALANSGQVKMNTQAHFARLAVSAGIAITLVLSMVAVGQPAFAAGPPPVGLGTADSFAVLAGTPAITNTGPTTITGDVGISPAAAVTGFPPGTVNGTIHAADAVALQAQSDLTIAYNDAAGRTPATTVAGGTLGGLTLVGGTYSAGGATLDLTGTLTLDAENDPSSTWIFQATSDLVTASSSAVTFINGGQACNVFWQVTSSATLGSGSSFAGTILALTSITMADGVTLDGRALARNGEVTMINDTITRASCAAPAPTDAPTPAATTAGGPTTPPTDTLPATDGPRSGPTWLVVVGIVLLALVADARRRSLCAIRARESRSTEPNQR